MPLTRNQSNAASQAKLSAADASETGTSKEAADQGGTSTESEPPRRDSPENCSICLGPFNNKSFTSSCAHSFCFVCLKQWSKVKAECPLCKQPFTSIFHNIRSNQQYDIYELPLQPMNQIDYNIFNHVGGPFPSFTAGPTYHLFNLQQPAFDADLTLSNFSRFQFRHRRYDRYLNPLHGEHPYSFSGPTINPSSHISAATWPRGAEEFRREVYRRNIGPPAVIIGLENSTYRLTPAMVSASAHRIHRIMPWLTRELRVLLRSHPNVRLAISVIQPLLTQVTIDSMFFSEKIVPLIGRHARQFIQEFVAFTNSALSMQHFDRKAMYRRREVAPTVPSSSSSPSSENDVVEVTDISPDVYPNASGPGPSQAQALNLNISGWDSPTPGPSWSTSVQNNHASVIDRVSVSSESDDPVYRPDLRDFDSNASRPGSDIIFVKYDKPWNERSPINLTSDSEGTGAERARKKKKSKHKKKKKEPTDNLESGGVKKDKTKKSSSKTRHRDKSKGSSKAASEEERDLAASNKRRHSQSSTEQHKMKKHKKTKKKEKLSDREIVNRYFAEAMALDKEANPASAEVKESDVSSKRKDKEKIGTSSSKEKSKKKKKSRKHSKDSHNQSYTHTYKKHPSGHKKSSNRMTDNLPEHNRHHLRRSPVRGEMAGASSRPGRHESAGNDNLSQHEGSSSAMPHSVVPAFQPSYLSMADTVQHIPVNLWVSTWPTLSVSHNYPPPPSSIPMGQNIPQSSNTSSSLAPNPGGTAGTSRYGLDMLSISSDSSSDSSDSESDDAQDLQIPSLQNVHSRTKQWLETNFPDLGRPQTSSTHAPTSSTTSSSTNDNSGLTTAVKKPEDDPPCSQNPLEGSQGLVEIEIPNQEKEVDVEVVSIPSGEEDVVVCSSDDSSSNVDDLWVIDVDQFNDKTKTSRKEKNLTSQPVSSKNDEIPNTSNISTLPFSGDISKSQSSIPVNIILPPTNKSFQPFKVQKKPAMPLRGKDPFFPSMTHSSDEDGEVDTILHGATCSDNSTTSHPQDSSVSASNKTELTIAKNLEDLITSTPPSALSLTNNLGMKEPVNSPQEIKESSSHSIFQPQNPHITLSTSLTCSLATDPSPIFSVLPPLTSSTSTSSALSSGINYLPYSNLTPPTSMSSILSCYVPQPSIPPPLPSLSHPLHFPFPQIPPLLTSSSSSNTILSSSSYPSQSQDGSLQQMEVPDNAIVTSSLQSVMAKSSENDSQFFNKTGPEQMRVTERETDNNEKEGCGISGSMVHAHADIQNESDIFSDRQCSTITDIITQSSRMDGVVTEKGDNRLHLQGQLRLIDFLDNGASFQVASDHEEKQQSVESSFPENCGARGRGDGRERSITFDFNHLCNPSELHKDNAKEFDSQTNSSIGFGNDLYLPTNLNNSATNGVTSLDSFSQQQDTNGVVKPFDVLESLSVNVSLEENTMTATAPLNTSHSTPGTSVVTTVANRFEQSVMLNSVPTEPSTRQSSLVSSDHSALSRIASYLHMETPAAANPEESHMYNVYSSNDNSAVHHFTDALQSSGTSDASSDSDA